MGTGGIARNVSLLLRLAAAPNADLMMPTFGSPVFKLAARLTAHALRLLGTDLGRDTEEILKVFDALPDATSRRAILRTLRSGVDWRGQVITMLDRADLTEGMPTLLLWGAHDAIIPVDQAHLAAAAMPGSRLRSSRTPATSRTIRTPSASRRWCGPSWPTPPPRSSSPTCGVNDSGEDNRSRPSSGRGTPTACCREACGAGPDHKARSGHAIDDRRPDSAIATPRRQGDK